MAAKPATALVIGGGPAGLMAAEELSAAGCAVTLVEAKPSLGRKFLMAGKSGLNLTKDEPTAVALRSYGEAARYLEPILAEFGPAEVQAWAGGLGQELFTGSSGRVFPKAMKASPLLRAWRARLERQGVTMRSRARWTGWDEDNRSWLFETAGDVLRLTPQAVVLALGGASWPRLGSDGQWAPLLARRGVEIVPFAPSNMGFRVNWSPYMAAHFGAPVKGAAIYAGRRRAAGEFVISARGVEGGAIYAVSRDLREGAALFVDLLPDWPEPRVAAALARPRGRMSLSNHLRKALRLDPVRLALLQEFARPMPQGAKLARGIKRLPLRHAGPRPLDEAISTAGGIAFGALSPALEITALPGVFAAGEMLDWEAPTGGYLLTACLATGRWAGRAAARRLGAGN